jgi:hypothetical protein
MRSNSEHACKKIISNPYMKHSVLKVLSKSKNATIPERQFIDRVEEVAKSLLKGEKEAFLKERDGILACVKNGFIEFDVEIVGQNSAGDVIFDIIIERNTAGGRRSKTRRTKKGKRKGRGRKTRQRK